MSAEGLSLTPKVKATDFLQNLQIAPALHDAAGRIGLDLPELRADPGRRAIELAREICQVEARSLDGDDASSAEKAVAARLGAPSVEALMADPVHISAAWAQALKNYPTASMKGNIDAPAKLLLLEYLGDIPVSAISVTDQREFFAWMARLPKDHGKKHGRNRYTSAGIERTKQEEIDAADARDAAAIAAMRARSELSDIEKRALLAEQLTPRLSLETLKRNRNGVNRIFKAARTDGGPAVPEPGKRVRPRVACCCRYHRFHRCTCPNFPRAPQGTPHPFRRGATYMV
ncbi:hypothetical protein [uncultured Paracoccus sp.]|uniref:hypothetical protein n=1 Tax=uncultured Paracoccus sp. TaxID=189685 RepID=UPI0026037BE7|nr:hypothetical protein [uncultured Paracoccus sp.]